MLTPNEVRKQAFFAERDIDLESPLHDLLPESHAQVVALRKENADRKREFFTERYFWDDFAMEVAPPRLPDVPTPAPDLPAPDFPVPD